MRSVSALGAPVPARMREDFSPDPTAGRGQRRSTRTIEDFKPRLESSRREQPVPTDQAYRDRFHTSACVVRVPSRNDSVSCVLSGDSS